MVLDTVSGAREFGGPLLSVGESVLHMILSHECRSAELATRLMLWVTAKNIQIAGRAFQARRRE